MFESKIITFRITGASPLLMHNPAGSMSAPSKELKSKKNIPSPEVEAEASTYRLPSINGEKGQLYAPSVALRSSLIDGGLNQKLGKESLRGLLAQVVFVVDEFCPLTHPDTGEPLFDYEIDTRRAVIQTSGIMRSRAKLPEWATAISLEYDPDLIEERHILAAFQMAGTRVGILDYRPRCPKGKGGPFGRYTVEVIE